MPIRRLRDYLDSSHVRYFVISHTPAYTAQEIAQAAHVPGKTMAKTVMVSVSGKMAMVVIPASMHLDLGLLRELCGTQDVKLAEENGFSGMFPECEIGAMPPFGNLYGMDVFADAELDEADEITFNAGVHTELLKLSWADYKKLVNPLIGMLTLKL
ncbi:MAG: YbaK/EbsC family protein [Chlorobiaceae bacterium]|nr:YbaK/EbsC family protein [Chlorobiaceae bacterium]